MKNLGAPSKPLEFDTAEDDEQQEPKDAEMEEAAAAEKGDVQDYVRKEVVPPTEDEFLWVWKVCRLLFPTDADANVRNHSPSSKLQGGRSSYRFSRAYLSISYNTRYPVHVLCDTMPASIFGLILTDTRRN